jgi:hypothetical protein
MGMEYRSWLSVTPWAVQADGDGARKKYEGFVRVEWDEQ